MKKYICTLILAIASIIGIQAQNANRSGVILELGAATPIKSDIINVWTNDEFCKMPVIVFDISAGYRFATSPNWAVDIKLNTLFDCMDTDPYDLLVFNLGSGIRYTSCEFYKNLSFYSSLNVGLGTRITRIPDTDDLPLYLSGIMELGLNLNEKISLGIFANVMLIRKIYWECNSGEHIKSDCKCHVDELCNNITLGVKLGYRF